MEKPIKPNDRLVYLYENFWKVGTVKASITELTDRGQSTFILINDYYGAEHKQVTLTEEEFVSFYELDLSGSFSLFSMKRSLRERVCNWKKYEQENEKELEEYKRLKEKFGG